jgi:glycosyltransferase involved in cell wall biosynthesis
MPVRDRRDLLRAALAALDQQQHRSFEVIVIDDGSTDGSDEEALGTTVAGRPVRLLRSNGDGAVAARIRGVAATDAPVLAFTDSDCVPAPDWLAKAMKHIDDGADLVHGRTMPARRPLPLERSVTDNNSGLFPTCNLVVTRAAYDTAGGFDPTAGRRWRFRSSALAKGTGFGEDTIFGWSIARTRATVYDETMVVHHHVFPPDLAEWVDRSWQAGAFPFLVREVPELRHTVVRRGMLWGKRSRVPVYATALAMLTRHPMLVAAASGWWVLHRYRYTLRHSGLPLPAQLQALPAQMMLDVIQAAALVTGSIRARTLIV